MRALLVDASSAGDARTNETADALLSILEVRGLTVRRVRLRELDIAPCQGCFGCWFKRPGECVVDDDARELAALMIGADLSSMVTPVRFGTYGPLAKRALDRMVPLCLPHFTMVRGELHHVPRYPFYPSMLVIGTSTLTDTAVRADEAALFARLVGRNAVNFFCETHASALVGPADDVSAALTRAADAVLGVKEATA